MGYAIAGQKDKPLVPASLLPSASDDDPKIAGTKDSGTSGDYSRADHVHPAETAIEQAVVTPYNLSSDLLPITYKMGETLYTYNEIQSIEAFDDTILVLTPAGGTPSLVFSKQTGIYSSTTVPGITEVTFGGQSAEEGVWPRLDVVTNSIEVRGEPVQLPLSQTQLDNIEAASTALQPARSMWYESNPAQYNDNYGGHSEIHFRPREVGLLDGGKIREIWFHTANSNAVNATVYLKLMSDDGSTTYATSDVQSINFTNNWAKFTFSTQVALSRDTMYKIAFFNSTNDAAQEVRARVR